MRVSSGVFCVTTNGENPMSSLKVEIRKTFCQMVVDGLPFDEQTLNNLIDVATAAAKCACNVSNRDISEASNWFLARFALDPMFSGISKQDSRGIHDSAVLATVDALKERGHSLDVFDVMYALKALREMKLGEAA